MGVNLRAARLSADQVETPERSREPWSRQKAGQAGVLWSDGPRCSPGVAVPKPSRAGGHSGSGSRPQSPAPRLRLGQRGGGKGRTRTARRDRRGRGRGGAAHALRAGTLRAARGERRCVQWRGAWGRYASRRPVRSLRAAAARILASAPLWRAAGFRAPVVGTAAGRVGNGMEDAGTAVG